MAKCRILLVDDEVDFLEILSKRLIKRGMDVDTATDGPTAIKKAEGALYDAVILDLAMPGMDGMETLENLLRVKPSLQVIVLTGHATVEKGVKAVKMGAADFLEKPAEIESLIQKVEAAQVKTLALFEENLDKKINNITRKRGW
jgi:DNA-binding NtrC family response regulator